MKKSPELIVCTHASCGQDWGSHKNIINTIGPAIDELRGAVDLRQKKCLRGCLTQEDGPFLEVSDNGLRTRFSAAKLSPIQIADKVRLILNGEKE